MLSYLIAVLATVKVRNLKANHSTPDTYIYQLRAVLATVKVRNLKANHSLNAEERNGVRLY